MSGIYKPFLKINDVHLPMPSRGLIIQRSQMVDSGRDATGRVVAQKINRRQIKLDSLVWPHLTASEWGNILTQIEKFEGTLEYFDALSGDFVTRKVYWGDATEEPFKIDGSGRITEYINCKCNLIDMGANNVSEE